MSKQNSQKSAQDTGEEVAADGALLNGGFSEDEVVTQPSNTDAEMRIDVGSNEGQSPDESQEEPIEAEAGESAAVSNEVTEEDSASKEEVYDAVTEPTDIDESEGLSLDSAEMIEANEAVEPVEGDYAGETSVAQAEDDIMVAEASDDLKDGDGEVALMETDAPVEHRPARSVEPQTAPLPQMPEQEALTPLPVGAVVDSRYIIQSQLHHSTDRNLYRVTARQQQWCANCGRLSPSNDETCGQCGSALEGQSPAEFYLMAESYRPESLIRDPSLMQFNLYHPNLVPVIDFFNYKPFGMMRYFAVAEPRQGVRLSQLSMPRAGGQVLSWAIQLADALDYLHERGVVGAGAEADDILVQGDRASLASLQNAHVTTGDDADLAQQQSIDLARLASTMFEAYTGQQSSLTPEGTLSMPPGAPEQVGAAFRAAIEPMQGSSPIIPVRQWRDLLARALEAVDELERPGRPVNFVSASLTNVGRVREQNQDSYGTAEWVQASVEGPMRMGLYIVADGMGGHKGGEVASALAVQSVSGELAARIVAPLLLATGDRSVPTNEAILQGMTRAVQSANERIFKARDNRQNDMGTTLVGMLIASGKAYIANVGDSRLYMYSTPHQEPRVSPQDAT
ncbi:MAG: protein phosphatase 2C domain-containing protein, partial [Chloroflexia bacterium]